MSSWLSHQPHPEIFPPLRKENKKEHQYGLHPAKTVGDTFVCMRVHSHPSAAWTPGQNHDYQLHSSPSPITGNREKTTSLTNPKMSIIIYKFTHQVLIRVSSCLTFKLANQSKIYSQSCHTEEDKSPPHWSTEGKMEKEESFLCLTIIKQSHMCYSHTADEFWTHTEHCLLRCLCVNMC